MAELFDSLAGRTRFTHHFCAVFNCILQPTGSNERRPIRQICGPVASDNRVKFGDPRLDLSQEIPPEAV